jgi:hypothetical protein
MVDRQVAAVKEFSTEALLQPCSVTIDDSVGSLLSVMGRRKDAAWTEAAANVMLKDLCGAGIPDGAVDGFGLVVTSRVLLLPETDIVVGWMWSVDSQLDTGGHLQEGQL